jgi:hypothetical protein
LFSNNNNKKKKGRGGGIEFQVNGEKRKKESNSSEHEVPQLGGKFSASYGTRRFISTGPSPEPDGSRPHRRTVSLKCYFDTIATLFMFHNWSTAFQVFQPKFCMRSSQLLCTPRVLPVFFLETLKKCKSVSKYARRGSMFGTVTRLQTEGPKNCVFSGKEKYFCLPIHFRPTMCPT